MAQNTHDMRSGVKKSGNPRYTSASRPATKRRNTEREEPREGREAQYFAANPEVAEKRHVIEVTLRGQVTPMETAGGVFSQDRLDLGTSVLLKKAPEPPETGVFLDLGCGWGPVAVALSQASPNSDIWAVDVNERAVELTADNATRNKCDNIHAVLPDAVPSELEFDLIWSNPPIRVGKNELHSILMTWLPRLTAGGEAYLVVSHNLGADSLMPWLAGALNEGAENADSDSPAFRVSKYASSKGYRVIQIIRNH